MRQTLECQFGLMGELDSRFVLSEAEVVIICRIGRNRGMFEENDKLLRIMMQHTDVEKHELFLQALIVILGNLPDLCSLYYCIAYCRSIFCI